MDKLRVLILSSWGHHVGGAQTHIDLLVYSLSSLGHRVKSIQRSERWLTNILALLTFFKAGKLGITGYHRYIVRGQYLQAWFYLAARQFQPSLIVAQDPLAALIAYNAYPYVPIIQTVHGPMYEHANECGDVNRNTLEYIAEIEKKSFQSSSRIITVDTGQANLAIKKGADPNKIHIIPNAVDIQRLKKMSQHQSLVYSTEKTTSYIIIARRLVPKNGVKYGIIGFSQSRWSQKTNLLIAGEGSEMNNLKKLTFELGIQDRVIFLGSVPYSQVVQLIFNASASIVPSVPYEGVIEATSLTALESLALETPLIASDIGGLTEINGGFGCIFLTPPGDSESIASAINDVFEVKKQTLLKIRRGRERVQKYDVSHWIDSMISVYHSVLD